jgi:LPS-assembly protein
MVAPFKHTTSPRDHRKLDGIDEFDRTIKFDEKDVIADTNEFEYGLTNRILVPRAGPDGSTPQAHELLDVTIAQKYFFDTSFGGALHEGVRNQFFPINTLSGFAYGGIPRRFSPLNVKARYRPTGLMYADLRMNYDIRYHQLRDILFGGGVTRGIFSVSHSWSTRQVQVDQFRYDPSTLSRQYHRILRLCQPITRAFGGVRAYDPE